MKKIFNNFEDYILAVMLLAMTILAFVNVVARYVFLASLPWIEELNRLGLVILSYAGAACALKSRSHLGLSIIVDRLPAKAQKYFSIFADACGIFFCYIGTRYGWLMTMHEKTQNVRTQGMQWPQWLFDLALPVGCFILGLRFLQSIILTLQGKDFNDDDEEEKKA